MLQCTTVFEKLWVAAHEMLYDEHGEPVYDRDEDTGLLRLDPVTKEPIHLRKYKYIKLRGGSRSSKTWSAIDVCDLMARELPKRITVWRDTKTDCVNTVLPDMLKRLQTTGRYEVNQTFNKTKSIFQYTNRSTVEMHGTDDMKTVMGLSGNITWLNEPYEISKQVFDQLDQRTTDLMILDLNPIGAHWSDDLDKDPRCLVLHNTFKDNAFCSPEERRKILSYQPVTLCDAVLGKLFIKEDKGTAHNTALARAYNVDTNPLNISPRMIRQLIRCKQNEYQNSASDYNWTVYGLGLKAEKPNRIFKWTKIPDHVFHALTVRTYTGVDWGNTDPFAIGDVKYYDGALYVHERNYESENVLRANLTAHDRVSVEALDTVIEDDGTGDVNTKTGIVTWLFRKLDIPYDRTIIADRNRANKILALRAVGYDYAVGASKLPGSIKDGYDLLADIPVYYTASSENIDREQENHSWETDKYGVIIDGKPEDKNNHHIDEIRYVAIYLAEEGIITHI